MKVLNVHGDDWEREGERKGYRWRARMISPVLGASMVGATLYELPPGEATFPTTTSTATRSGCSWSQESRRCARPRASGSSRPDVVCFPEGSTGAHQVRNGSYEPVRIVIFSTKRAPSVAVYPDSDKMGVWPASGDATDRIMLRRDSAV